MRDKPMDYWWHCPIPGCKFKMLDDGSLAAAKKMGQHAEEHERAEKQKGKRIRGNPRAVAP